MFSNPRESSIELLLGKDEVRRTTDPYEFSVQVSKNYTPSWNFSEELLQLQVKTLDAHLWEHEVRYHIDFSHSLQKITPYYSLGID